MPSPTRESRLVLIKDLVHRRTVGGQIFIVTDDSTMLSLVNETAVALWNALEEAGAAGTTTGWLVNALVEGFEVDAATARRDVLKFLGELTEIGVVAEVANGSPEPD